MREVLVTGASSDFMRRVIRRIDRDRFRVFALCRSPPEPFDGAVEIVRGDLENRADLVAAVRGKDLVLHAAAITHARNRDAYFRTNVEGTRNLVSACRLGDPPPKLAYVSSRTAMPNAGAYGESKLVAEAIVRELPSWIIMRPGELFGGNKGEGIDALIESIRAQKLIPCPVGLHGTLRPMHVDDAAATVHRLVFEEWTDGSVQPIHGPRGYHYRELVHFMARHLDRRVFALPVPKLALQLAGALARLGLDLPLVPDQVARLYCEKDETDLPPPDDGLPLEAYLSSLTSPESSPAA